MDSYNLILYNARTSRGMTIRAFAKELHINAVRYRLIENGYLKPLRKDIGNITNVIGVDYAPYTEGAYSYPAEKDDVRRKFLRVFDFIGSTPFKIAMLVLTILSFGLSIAGYALGKSMESTDKKSFSPEYVDFYEKLSAEGAISFSLVNSFKRPVIYESTEDRFISLKSEYDSKRLGELEAKSILWTDTFRCVVKLISIGEDSAAFSYDIAVYETRELYAGTYVDKTGVFTGPVDDIAPYMDAVETISASFFDDLDELLKEKLNVETPARSLLYEAETMSFGKVFGIIILVLIFIGGMAIGMLTLFGFIYSFIYGTKHGVERDFRREISLFPGSGRLPKRDISFSPFIPETVLEIIGITLLAIANLRIQIYMVLAINPDGAGMSIAEIKNTYNALMLVFYAGMFLLYFVDFDLYLDDKRVLRNIVAYSMVFIGLYAIEVIFLGILNPDSLIFRVVEFKLPNAFSSITMYFVIMYLLYFTPKFINTKKKLIVFRSLSVLPVLFITATSIIFKGANSSFGWDWPNWKLYLFASEKIPFSLLCVLYLYGLYFLRLHFRRKYGDEVAANYYNGNRFLFLKNMLICAIVLVISIADYVISKTVPAAKSWGFGYTYYTVFLIPVLMFYHPHKGPRNRGVDYASLALYFLALIGVLSFLFNSII